MSRIRMVKPAFFKHADLYDAEVSSGFPLRVAFAALWTVADKRGVFPWSRNIKPDVIPYDPCDMLAVLDALAAAGFIRRYEVDGKSYGIIPTLGEHQHFHKDEKANALPAPQEHPASTVLTPVPEDASTTTAGRHTTYDIRLAETNCPDPASVAVTFEPVPELLAQIPPSSRPAWEAVIATARDGMPGRPALTAAQIDAVCTDFMGKPGALENPSLRHFRGFLDAAARPRPPRPVYQPTSARPSKQEAGRAALAAWVGTPEESPNGQ